VTLRQRIRFYQQLAMLVRAGVPIRGCLERLQGKMSVPELKTLSEKVNAGERIGDAFEAAKFQPFETHLIAAGEKSAQLDTIFTHLSDFWARELAMRQALVRPLYYPIVILHLVVLLSCGVELVTMEWPVVLRHFILTMVGFYGLGITIFFFVRASWQSESMRRIWYYVPLIGGSLKTAYAYRWITTLRLEFSAGVSLYRAVGDAWRASGYAGSELRAVQGEEQMLRGEQLSKLMRDWTQLPRDWIDFIETGEISGALEEALKSLEAEAAEAWTQAQRRMSDWLPKIVYFVALVFVAIQVGSLMYKVEIQPVLDVEKQIDDATGNK
jgi:type II secretory pathway component PulF